MALAAWLLAALLRWAARGLQQSYWQGQQGRKEEPAGAVVGAGAGRGCHCVRVILQCMLTLWRVPAGQSSAGHHMGLLSWPGTNKVALCGLLWNLRLMCATHDCVVVPACVCQLWLTRCAWVYQLWLTC